MKSLLHYRPEKNWINDPNGLCQINGIYHLFHQYNPNGNIWGDMHWGHAYSTDLYHWETMPIALSPDYNKGEIHCFSGSCCKDAQGYPHFFYTSIGKEENGRDCISGAEQWSAEPSDEEITHLIQSNNNALTADIHKSLSLKHWRDPYVIHYGDQYLMVLGGCLDGYGCILLYTSEDMYNWKFHHTLLKSDVPDDVPWECPNLFILDGKAVVFCSPCDKVNYYIGDLDDNLYFHVERNGILDPAGRQGYYAPQAFCDENENMILFGWMPETDGTESADQRGWSGVMSLPRLLTIREGDLYAEPLSGWEKLTTSHIPLTHELINSDNHFIITGKLTSNNSTFKIHITTSGKSSETILELNTKGQLLLDAEDQSSSFTICRNVEAKKDGSFFLCVDGNALECMVNGKWLSGRVYSFSETMNIHIEGDIKGTFYYAKTDPY